MMLLDGKMINAVTKHPLGTMNVCTKFGANSLNMTLNKTKL